MRNWLYTALTAVAITLPGRAEPVPQSLPPIDAFSALPAASNPALSPDGKRLALIQAYQGRPVASVWNLELPGAKPVFLPYEEGFIDDVRWANNQRLLVRINLNAKVWGDNVNPWHRTASIDPDTRDGVVLFANKQKDRDVNYSASRIIDMAPDDPDHIYMPLWAGGGVVLGNYDEPHSTVFQVDVNTGRAKYLEVGNKNTINWLMDGSGKVVARIDRTKSPLTDHLFAYNEKEDWREIATADATGGHAFGMAGLSLDGKEVILNASPPGEGTDLLIAMSLADGKAREFFSNPIYDIEGTIADPWTGRIIGATYTSHYLKTVFFDEILKQVQSELERQSPGMAVVLQSWDRERKKIVFSTDGPAAPATFYLFDSATRQIDRLGRTYAKLQPGDLGQVRVYDYQARDGLSIPAYLTLPPGKEAKNLPVVILPHGGPASRDSMHFDWERQFLANRGYAVLQPNFRGSTGYGTKFEREGYGQWGLKMQDDITDGVKKLIADGIADPKRICIVGGSYGGYAALAGVAFTPELYACAAAWAPVSDLRAQLDTEAHDSGGSNSWLMSAESRYIGDRRNDAQKLDDASPAKAATKITAPVLLMHGEADSTVRIDQSEIMERALRRAGKKVSFVRIPKETHYMQTAETRQRWLTELEAFLKANIGN